MGVLELYVHIPSTLPGLGEGACCHSSAVCVTAFCTTAFSSVKRQDSMDVSLLKASWKQGHCTKGIFRLYRRKLGGFCSEGGGAAWIGRGHVGQGSGKGPGASGGPAWRWNLLRTLSMHRPARQGTDSPLGAGPLPHQHTPPPTHVLPSPPLVTLALTYINPISHTRTNSPAEHTQAHPDKEVGPQRGLVCLSCLFPSA